MEIKRDIYLNRLVVRKHNGFIKVITIIAPSDFFAANGIFVRYIIHHNREKVKRPSNIFAANGKNIR